MKTSLLAVAAAALLGACSFTTGGPAFTGAAYCGTVTACDEGCTRGDAHACGYMSQAAMMGAGIPRSAERFLSYARKGCDGGDGRSCAQVALAYFAAIGVAQDWQKAVEYNDKSCVLGFSVGCNSLGLAYRDGHGVAKDPARASTLFAQSCDGGSALGCLSLAQESPDGMVPEDRAAKALPLLVHDCDPGANPAIRVCTVAARMYAAGRGAARDDAQARSLYEAACHRGDPDACDLLRRR